jgi:23S rRNA (pseudouridine1915-N3)-methyltransferase
MIEINVISVGNVKEKYLQELIADYKKRISKYAKIELIELKDESNKINENIVKETEGERILSSIKEGFYVILLDLRGQMLDSISLSKKLDEISTYHSSKIAFIIGGSFGVSEDVKKRANYMLSFSKMTFPHQLAKGMLLEQIYRSFKILNNETYHK